LPNLVRDAQERNPEIQVAARTLEAKRSRVPQAAALADPINREASDTLGGEAQAVAAESTSGFRSDLP
jgi:hypothetical protein